jgi:hypothetical protein
MAFTSAALALDPLAAWARNEQSWDTAARNIREALRREFRLRLNSAALLHSFLLNRTRQRFLGAASQTGLLPLDLLYRLLH